MYNCHWQLRPIIVVQILFYAISYLPKSDVYLSITPGRFFMPNYWMWTIFTFSFYNYSIFYLFSDLITLFLLDNLLSFYNWSELLKFCGVVNVSTAFSTMFFLIISFAVTLDPNFLFEKRICGFVALLGGVTVVGRQTMGHKLLLDFPLGNIRYKHISFICFIFAVLLRVLGILNVVPFVMFTFGVVNAWIYLRFYQKHTNGVVGDLTDTFAFSGFFPNHLEPPVAILGNALFNLLVRLRICKKTAPESKALTPSVMSFTVSIDQFADSSKRSTLSTLVSPESVGLSNNPVRASGQPTIPNTQ